MPQSNAAFAETERVPSETSTVTRAQLAEAVHRATGLPRSDGAIHVESFLELISATLREGEPVLLSGFGKFVVLGRAPRKGRNVKLGVDVPIAARQAIVFKPAPSLLVRLNPTHRNKAGRGRTSDGEG
ncbi:MAG: integration host factor, alpha subunit [Hyphomicrobiales bacterium]|nr:integration host factor, alpha subunit [Hyphomicrobiales bacterium]